MCMHAECTTKISLCDASAVICSAKKSLKELQQLMFKLKDEVFANPRAGFAFNTKAMERMIMEEFGTDMLMCHVKKPK